MQVNPWIELIVSMCGWKTRKLQKALDDPALRKQLVYYAMTNGVREATEAVAVLPEIKDDVLVMVERSEDEHSWINLANACPELALDLQKKWFIVNDFGRSSSGGRAQARVAAWSISLRSELQDIPLYVESLIFVRDFVQAFGVAKKRTDGACLFCVSVLKSAESDHYRSVSELLKLFPENAWRARMAAAEVPVARRVAIYSALAEHLSAAEEERRMISAGLYEDVKIFARGLKREEGPGAEIIAVDHLHDL